MNHEDIVRTMHELLSVVDGECGEPTNIPDCDVCMKIWDEGTADTLVEDAVTYVIIVDIRTGSIRRCFFCEKHSAAISIQPRVMLELQGVKP